MAKELNNYLHLYLGYDVSVQIEVYGKIRFALLTGINNDYYFLHVDGDMSSTSYYRGKYSVKPILRPLSDMTEEEKTYISMMWNLEIDKNYCIEQSGSRMESDSIFEVTQFLLSKQFDIFELIDAEIAIDKTASTPNP
jgi:hypothetical protein